MSMLIRKQKRTPCEILIQNSMELSFLFSVGAKLFPKAKAARAFPPTPFLPAPPERIRRAKRGVISLRNGFALFSEYPTIQNFSTFSLGTRPNARRAQWRGEQGIEPKNSTVQKMKRKRIVYLKS